MTSEEELRKLIEQDEAKRSERIASAVKRGGLPTESESGALYTGLQEVFDELEQIVWRVEGIASSDDGSDLPSVISLEEIGVIAVMVSDTAERAGDFRRFADRLLDSVSHLDTIRHNQLTRAEQA